MKKRLFSLFVAISLSTLLWGQQGKTVLSHSDYDGWRNLKHQQISNDGSWISYEINPQKGDGWLYLYNVKSHRLDSVARGANAVFTPDSKILTFRIRVPHDTLRQAKLAKKKKSKMPKDSLGIWNLVSDNLTKIARVKSFKVGKDKGVWIAYLKEQELAKKDTINGQKNTLKTNKSKNKSKEEGSDLVVFNPLKDERFQYKHVTEYAISRDGSALGFICSKDDSVATASIKRLDLGKGHIDTLMNSRGVAKKIALSSQGGQVAFLFSEDTIKAKVYSLYEWRKKELKTRLVADTSSAELPDNWTVSDHGSIAYSRNGEHLFFGVAFKPMPESKDTLLEDEKYSLDVWNWKDPLLQSQQKVEAKKEKNRTYLAVYHTEKGKVIPLGNQGMPKVETFDHGNAALGLGSSSLPYQQLESWDDWYRDYYLVDVNTGKKSLVLEKMKSTVSISPAQKYLFWYETQDSTWYAYDISAKHRRAISKRIDQNLYDEVHDIPSDPSPYGLVGWTKGDKYALIRDRYDIWKVDPSGSKIPQNITRGYGRRNKIRFSYVSLDKEERFVMDGKKAIIKGFHEENKNSGFFTLSCDGKSDPQKLVYDPVNYRGPAKAKNAEVLIWTKSTFKQYPDLWVSGKDFSNARRISNTNPQQKNYRWGNVKLVDWTSGDGEKLQGMLFTPEDFDPNKKYPMLVYFYERSSDDLHNHYVPQPNWSIINPSYCVSNGYVVFMPDINYHKVGYPGECAYSAIVTGTLAMLDRYPFIDGKNVALQGQSWGGYQIAYLVTRTNLYKCAMAGAPVSNMTSAYGGIRWQSGRSRMFQYEHTQSRIGGTLWNSTLQYIENSPIFYAPKIETPLLIMHNDADGAVPWYQGIELFVSLRRLQKPCWMLSYNNEAHNLKRRANRMDLSIRMMQFFDHYLKGEPSPAWMIGGVPAVKKGSYDGYELNK